MTVFKAVREELEQLYPGEFRFIDSATRIGATHKPTNTRLRVLSMATQRLPKASLGCRWRLHGRARALGKRMAVLWRCSTRFRPPMGKPNSELIGDLHRAHLRRPVLAGGMNWWAMVHTGAPTFRRCRAGRADRWDKAREIARVNPLMWAHEASRRKLLEERDESPW